MPHLCTQLLEKMPVLLMYVSIDWGLGHFTGYTGWCYSDENQYYRMDIL